MYQALYRKWRPKTFADVVGQEHITQTLRRQAAQGRLSHAYLFTGSRGTGKTTCAKILAKAVNCQNPSDGDPCGQCPACLGIDNGSLLDVMELEGGFPTENLPKYLLGMAVAAVVGYFSIQLVKLLADKGRFGAFAFYCWGAGALFILLNIMGWSFVPAA